MAKILMIDPDTDEVERSFNTLSDVGYFFYPNNSHRRMTIITSVWRALKYGYIAYGKSWKLG